jgi:hypothetical protein
MRNEPHAERDLRRFLTTGYAPRVYWWELVVVIRKLTITGFLALVQPGSLLQLFSAVIFSLCLLAIEIYVQPFETPINNFLSLIAGLALVLTLVGTLGFRLAVLNLSTGFITTTAMLGVLVAAALIVLLAALAVLVHAIAKERRVVVARFTAPPRLPVSPRHLLASEYHCLVSHQWGSGQDQANALKSRLQALAPGLQVFLDVEDLTDTSQLEEYVKVSDVLICFLSGSVDATAAKDPLARETLAFQARSDCELAATQTSQHFTRRASHSDPSAACAQTSDQSRASASFARRCTRASPSASCSRLTRGTARSR